MKPIKPVAHTVIDYLMVLALLAGPAAFGFAGTAGSTVFQSVGWAYLALVLLTAYPGGLIRLIPFTVHGGLEFLSAILLLVSPWAFGFSTLAAARDFGIGSGIALAAVWYLTDYRAAPPANYSAMGTGRSADPLTRKEKELVR